MSEGISSPLAKRAVAEGVGTAFLLATVVGSGIMGERLAGGSVGLALLANTVATGAALAALILTFGPLSGAHFNPAVTLAVAAERGLPWREVPHYLIAQLLGAVGGVGVANLMFELPLFSFSQHVRHGPSQLLSEFVATFGLLAVIWGCSRLRSSTFVAPAVAAYITAAYWFTASTSFANPAVTVARSLSDTFAGIRPTDVPGFVAAQVLGAATATALFRWLVPTLPATAPRILANARGRASLMTRVLFACMHNAGRSQMAAALFNVLADPARAHAVSAGTQPGERVHPEVVTVLREAGLDLSTARPHRLTDELACTTQLLVTMGCGDECPLVPGVERMDWPLPDPKGRPLEEVRRIRDDIRRRVESLLQARGWKRGVV